MQILVLLDMYSDAVVVFVTSQTLFRLALAILCPPPLPAHTSREVRQDHVIVGQKFNISE